MPFKMGLAQKRKEQLEEELKRIIPKIIELNVEKIILFGSIVSGSMHKRSDLDILVVKDTSERFMDRLERFYLHIKPRIALDILVYTPAEFEEMSQNNQFIKTILKNGRIVYER